MRNSLPVKKFGAEDLTGLKINTEDMGRNFIPSVGKRSSGTEAIAEAMVELGEVRMLARVTTMGMRYPHTENRRFPWQWLSSKG